MTIEVRVVKYMLKTIPDIYIVKRKKENIFLSATVSFNVYFMYLNFRDLLMYFSSNMLRIFGGGEEYLLGQLNGNSCVWSE